MFNLGFGVLKFLFESERNLVIVRIFTITAFNLEHFRDVNWRNALRYPKHYFSFVHQMTTYLVVFEHLPMIYNPYQVSINRLFSVIFQFYLHLN